MITIKRETLIEALYEADLDEDAIYEDYSGRGMYGATCLGITYDGADKTARICLALERAGESEAAELLADGGETDSMGRGMIRYWRGLTLEEE